ncbi:MAG: aminopeptidase [Spongiibacteraceae bacterium]|nr:aminopeptidase [Spongiibacteraceae bacterium]
MPEILVYLLKALVCVLLLVLLSGCTSINYYAHLAKGQLAMLSQRQSIVSLLESDELDPDLRARLLQVQRIRQFSSSQLGLADNDSYRYYTDLKRPYAIWNVFAAPAFSIMPMQWCFPFAGCVSYRGYFSEESAQAFADQLKEKGLDTYVGGVAAYSTLGWFDDPVLNTFLGKDETRLAALLFHELAHQQVYLPGDTDFNESFARCVEIAGVKRWLNTQGQTSQIDQYLQQQAIKNDFVEMMLALQASLDTLYQQTLPDEKKRIAKRQRIENFLHQTYPEFKTRWNGYSGYDLWVKGKTAQGESNTGPLVLNNAKLSTIASYHRWLPAFEQLLLDVEGDFKQFYQQVEQMSEWESGRRQQTLEQLDKRARAEHLLH